MDHQADQEHAHHDHIQPHVPGEKQQHPLHGSYIGHAIPGTFFIAWSSYWLWSILDIHLRRRHLTSHQRHAARRKTHPGLTTSLQPNQGWYPWPYWPVSYLEPIMKVIMPLLGVLVELWIGWGFHWRPMFEADGHFAEFHINNWQHALMYGGYALSGLVDLIGTTTQLPQGTEQAFNSFAFLSETLLMGLHSKHNALDKMVHQLLTGLMVGCTLASGAEVVVQGCLMLALAKTLLVFLQGTWFWHVGRILYLDNWAWDMNAMSSTMFIPVVFTCHILIVGTLFLMVYLGMQMAYSRLGYIPCHPPKSSNAGAAFDAELEMGELQPYEQVGQNGKHHDPESHSLLANEGGRKAAHRSHRV